jgi:hypothetical protein
MHRAETNPTMSFGDDSHCGGGDNEAHDQVLLSVMIASISSG